MGSCKKKPEAPQKQSKPEEKLRAAQCQQGTPAVATAVALFYGVCRGSGPVIYRHWLLPTHMCQPPKPAFVTPCAILRCMQGVRPCHFIDPGFCQPACVAPITRICHPLCHFMVYAGGQHLSFYRPWLLLTRICHPQNPHVSPPVLFYRSCRESDPSFCQSRHALKQSMWIVWLHSSFMFI